MAWWRIGMVCLIAASGVNLAAAQNVIFDAPGLTQPKKAPTAPPPRAAATAWPRLDPGAVFCRTADDLSRHAQNMTARISGGDSQPVDCRIIAQPTGVQILSRQGLGSTQVKLSTADSQTGWTDVWLPDRAPTSR